MLKLNNKKAIVTGASSGIGQAIAVALAKEGCDVVITYHHNQAGANHTVSEIQALGRKALALSANMAVLADLERLMEDAITFLKGVDILVNNAGTLTRHASFLEISPENLDQVLAVNLKAPFILTQKAALQMQKQGVTGNIINISSISAEVTTAGLTHYDCSKAGVHRLTKATALALAPYGIRVNAIAPGIIPTHINEAQRREHPDAWTERISHIPLGRCGSPQDIAQMAVVLASSDSDWITGSIITVDGGSSL